MRVLISGPVTRAHLQDADLMAGIQATSFVSNGYHEPPAATGLPMVVMRPDPKLGTGAEQARNYTLVQSADALICIGDNPHLTELAEMYGLPVHQES